MMMMSLVRPSSGGRLITSVAVAALLMAPGTARGGDGDSSELAAHGQVVAADANLPEGVVLVEILEGLPKQLPPKGSKSRNDDESGWGFPLAAVASETYSEPAFGFVGVPRRYSDEGFIVDRASAFMLRASARVTLPEGGYRLLLRSFNAAKLYLDDHLVADTPWKVANADGHEPVPELPQAVHPDLRSLQVGHAEQLVEIELDGDEHVFRLEVVAGGKSLRREIGELSVSVLPLRDENRPGGFQLLRPDGPDGPGRPDAIFMSDAGWLGYAREARERLARADRRTRREKSRGEDPYWRRRHQLARERALSLPPLEIPDGPIFEGARSVDGVSEAEFGSIDRFVLARLATDGIEPAPVIDDMAFLRRVSLDTRGVIPTFEEIDAFMSDVRPDRRRRFIDRMLESPDWADHWVPYWQDVLAENPGILKPKLNNTGPFRWWIHESFEDNVPMDRFVTELILMRGSRYGGGPAGFSMATQNDVPMAAKAHILATAFLGVQMKCARCHDAPHHESKQKDLFSLAAMLGRGPQKVPKTSSVPRTPEELDSMLIEVTLKPGSKVEPFWPFGSLIAEASATALVRQPEDSRERLAALITSPENDRFARVIVNRLWKRYLGYGLVEPVDDWEAATPSHPELLEYLGRELMAHDYDLKHLARSILNSRVYQRAPRGDAATVPEAGERLFAGPARRRMTAEQLVDSLFQVAGKSFDSEELNLDVDGRRPVTSFLNLGRPRRAWEFVTLSNERDRPALSMPVAQSVLDVLQTFGWRETRQNPLTVREDVATVLQPLILANGTVAHRIATLSEDHALTETCLVADDLDGLITRVFRRFLTRDPTPDEEELYRNLLAGGFDTRVVTVTRSGNEPPRKRRHAVSWSNHLSAEATLIKIELEAAVRRGDPPTRRLDPDWRERMEDGLWALVNSPEFLFIP